MGDAEIIEAKFKKARYLYNEAKKETLDNNLPDPEKWIHNKDELKNGWKEYVDKANSNIIFKMTMLNNSFSHYMQYMYDNF